MKIQKKKIGGGGRGLRAGWGVGWVGLGGQGGCERRIEVFVKIPKKKLGGVRGGGGRGRVGGVRVVVIEELKFWGKFTKQKIQGGGGVG